MRNLIGIVLAAAITLSLASCGGGEGEIDSNVLLALRDKQSRYVELLRETPEAEVFLHPCDELTFEGLLSSLLPEPRDLSGHEWGEPGLFYRDEGDCHGEGRSRSDTSPENMVGILHHAWRWGDSGIAERMREYGESHNWIFGQGDGTQDAPQMEYIINLATSGSYFGLRSTPEIPLTSPLEFLSDYRGYVLLDILYLSLRASGELSWGEERLLEQIDNPLARALNQVLDSGGPTLELLDILSNLELFPAEKIPPGTSSFTWGSCPDVVWYLWAMDIIGRGR